MSAPPRRGSYPHPVVDESDDVSSTFRMFNLAWTPSVDYLEITFQISMDDPTILGHMSSGRARYSLRWSCAATLSIEEADLQQTSVTAGAGGYSAVIPQEMVAGPLRLELRILATEDISTYSLERQHPEYGDAEFSVRRGDILGIGGQAEFEVTKLYDPMNPPLGSCFRFMADRRLTRGIDVRFDDTEYVTVILPEKVLSGFRSYADRPDLQISLVVLPALIHTLVFMKQSPDSADVVDTSWHRALTRIIDRVGSLTDDTALGLAQRMLDNPLDRSLLQPYTTEDDQ